MHPHIAAEIARQLLAERIEQASAARRHDGVARKVVTSQRALVRDSLIRVERGEERA